MDAAMIERRRDELLEAQARAGALLAELHAAIIEAHNAGESVTRIAALSGMSRPKVYDVLRRGGVEVDSERGRGLVARRWQGDRQAAAIVEPPSAGLDGYLERRAAELGEHPIGFADAEAPDLFDVPVDGAASESISVLEAIDRFREEARARGLRD